MSKKRMPPEVAEAVIDRADGWCEALIPSVCTGAPEQLHHRQLRKQGGEHTTDNLVAICASCHSWIHAHPRWAYRAGLLVKSFNTPVFPPAFYRGVMREEEEE
ncbi:HNH endonuclease [Corynebacterium nuruki]|uniref:HNH endonuclease n=1 Tax=Corynebacterium nuruki TaxID=1032851 RepID=UPI0002485E3E|nr:HNH endonuclease [Corynebacterium nuruki]